MLTQRRHRVPSHRQPVGHEDTKVTPRKLTPFELLASDNGGGRGSPDPTPERVGWGGAGDGNGSLTSTSTAGTGHTTGTVPRFPSHGGDKWTSPLSHSPPAISPKDSDSTATGMQWRHYTHCVYTQGRVVSTLGPTAAPIRTVIGPPAESQLPSHTYTRDAGLPTTGGTAN